MIVDTVIIGAGISGLSTALYLTQLGYRVLVLERDMRIGGAIQTEVREGYLLEKGPNTFPASAEELLTLCEFLDLTPVPAHPQAKNRYVYLRSQLQAVPTSPQAFFASKLLSPKAKWSLVGEPFRRSVDHKEDESVAAFIRRRLDSEILDHLVAPFLGGVYAGDPEQLSLPAVFPRLARWEHSAGSLLSGLLHSLVQKKPSKRRSDYAKAVLKGGRHRLLSFENGMQELPQALAAVLPQGTVRVGKTVRNLGYSPIAGFSVSLMSGETLYPRSVVLATSAHEAARMMDGCSATFAKTLRGIPYAHLAVVHTGFQQTTFPRAMDGFGFLTAPKEKLPLLGSIWSSSLFPNRSPVGTALLTNYIGGELWPDLATDRDETFIQLALQGLKKAMRAEWLEPLFVKLTRYRSAIPQYTLGHRQRVRQIEGMCKKEFPGLFVAGNYLHGISLNDCVLSGKAAARGVRQFLKTHYRNSTPEAVLPSRSREPYPVS